MDRSSEKLNTHGPAGRLTLLLRAAKRGDESARSELYSEVYDRLRQIAAGQLRSDAHGIEPASLVHDAYMKIFGTEGGHFNDRAHFFAVNARAMRRLLVDRYRHRSAARRGGGDPPVQLREDLVGKPGHQVEIAALDQALVRLERLDPRLARVVECKYFGGMTDRDLASGLGITERTVRNDWKRAKTWLARRLLVCSSSS